MLIAVTPRPACGFKLLCNTSNAMYGEKIKNHTKQRTKRLAYTFCFFRLISGDTYFGATFCLSVFSIEVLVFVVGPSPLSSIIVISKYKSLWKTNEIFSASLAQQENVSLCPCVVCYSKLPCTFVWMLHFRHGIRWLISKAAQITR